LRASGPNAIVRSNPFTFSTKYRDEETGLVYYGLRYYNAGTGRWLSRDPMQESESLNPYSYADNVPTLASDFLGLYVLNFPGDWPSHQKAIMVSTFRTLTDRIPSILSDIRRGKERANELPNACAYKQGLLKALNDIEQLMQVIKNGLDGNAIVELRYDSFPDPTTIAEVREISVRTPNRGFKYFHPNQIFLNSTPDLASYFFLMNENARTGLLLHELTHFSSTGDLEDSASQVWKTGPFYNNFGEPAKDPLDIWGYELLRWGIKAKTGDVCCPKVPWPHNEQTVK